MQWQHSKMDAWKYGRNQEKHYSHIEKHIALGMLGIQKLCLLLAICTNNDIFAILCCVENGRF